MLGLSDGGGKRHERDPEDCGDFLFGRGRILAGPLARTRSASWARLRTLRSDLIDPTIAVHNGRIVKRTGDGALVEFRSVVDAVRCAIEIQNAMVERNAGVPEDRHIVFRIGIHLGDVVEESDGDLMGDGVNIAARLEGSLSPARSAFPRTPTGKSSAARPRGQRSRRDQTQEHRRANSRLLASGRASGPGENGGASVRRRPKDRQRG